MSDPYIFLAEDNPNDVVLTIRALKRCQIGNRLVTVPDGKKAIEYLFGQKPDQVPAVILLDLKLPFLSGLEVLRQIRSHESTAHLPVIVLSASIDDKDNKESILLGANAYFCKPVNFDDFVLLMKNIFSSWLAKDDWLPPAQFSGMDKTRS